MPYQTPPYSHRRAGILSAFLSVSFVLIGTNTANAQPNTLSDRAPTKELVPSLPEPFIPQFATGYEPNETTSDATNPTDTITWMTFANTSPLPDAPAWAMSVYYENAGNTTDRYARLSPDPTIPPKDPPNTVLHYWLKNATIDAGYQQHTKGRIQTGFPGQLVDAYTVYASQRIYLPEDINLLLAYPPDADQWWIGIILQELWMGAAWENHPNPSRIGLTLAPYGGSIRLALHLQTMPEMTTIWEQANLEYQVPVGQWFTLEMGIQTGDAKTGRVALVITPDETGVSTLVFDVNNWTYSPLADEPGGTGPVPLTHWNPQKLYSSDNVIHFIRDSGGVLQAYFDDFAFADHWPTDWPNQ